MRKALGIILSTPLFFQSCVYISQTQKNDGVNPTQIVEEKLVNEYYSLINTPCKRWRVRDLIAFAYNIAPYGEKEKFLELYRSLPDECLNQPVSNVDWGVVKGTIKAKEESCLGDVDFKNGKEELLRSIYTFVVQKCSQSTQFTSS